MINSYHAYIHNHPIFDDSTKQGLGDMLQRLTDSDPQDVAIFKYFDEYATLTT
jgi:hypothetical protein